MEPRTRVGRRVAVSALVALLVLVGGACGDQGDDSGSSGGTSAEVDASSRTLERDTAEPAAGSTEDAAGSLVLSSTAFEDGGALPARYACEEAGGDGQSPPLAWAGVPEEAESLVLVVHDPDAPVEGGFTHLVTTFPATDGSVPAGANAESGPMADWVSACPPDGEHRYVFSLLAFAEGEQPEALTRESVEAAAGDALATAEITATFAAP